MQTHRPADFVDLLAGLLILAFCAGFPIVILLMALNR